MTDELRDKAKAFAEKDGCPVCYINEAMMADFAAECVRAERERVANGIKDKIELTLVSNENGAGIDLTKVLYLYIDELRGDK